MEKPLLLIVDDTPQNLELLTGILKPDYRIKVATSGIKALQIVKQDPKPDLILLDIMMPDLDGYEVCRIIKRDRATKHIPIIFVTAKISAEDEIKGLDLGAADYLTKPISPEIAKQRIKTHLALYQQNKALYFLVKQKTEEIELGKRELLETLGKAAEFKDNETGMHVIRVSKYCRVLAEALGLPLEQVDLIQDAAPMHDIGKIGIPDHILLKPGKLDINEWEVMKKHVEYGIEILTTSGSKSELVEVAATIASSHHEKWDGSGYPLGLSGEDIPIEGRIVALADVFDALTAERPYKNAWSTQDAAQLIVRESGSHFDPAIVAVFQKQFEQFVVIQERYQDQ